MIAFSVNLNLSKFEKKGLVMNEKGFLIFIVFKCNLLTLSDRGQTRWNFVGLIDNSCYILIGFFTMVQWNFHQSEECWTHDYQFLFLKQRVLFSNWWIKNYNYSWNRKQFLQVCSTVSKRMWDRPRVYNDAKLAVLGWKERALRHT